MVSNPFDRETMLDLTVNAVPLGILLFFIVLFGVVNPFGFDNVISTIQFSIVGISAILLLVLTYYSGLAVQNAERESEMEASAKGDAQTGDDTSGGAATDTDEA